MSVIIQCEELFKNKLKTGINLFTGSGFSVLESPDGDKLPTAEQLCGEIIEHFALTGVTPDDGLSYVCEFCSETEYQQYLRQRFSVTSYNPLYDAITKINLKSVVTTNIDNIIRKVVDNDDNYYIQNIREYGASTNSPNELIYIPIHGDVNKRITEIEAEQQTLIWDDSFSVDSKSVDKFCEENSDDVVKLFSDEGNTPLSSIYKEFRYNYYTAKKRGWNLFDRCISDSVEMCDLSNPNEAFIHCKIGKATNLEACLRQSMISLLYFFQNQPLIEGYENREGERLTKPKEITVLYLSESDVDSSFKISTLKSLKCKLTFLNWYNQCKSMRYTPKLIVAKYNKT